MTVRIIDFTNYDIYISLPRELLNIGLFLLNEIQSGKTFLKQFIIEETTAVSALAKKGRVIFAKHTRVTQLMFQNQINYYPLVILFVSLDGQMKTKLLARLKIFQKEERLAQVKQVNWSEHQNIYLTSSRQHRLSNWLGFLFIGSQRFYSFRPTFGFDSTGFSASVFTLKTKIL
ncbi:Hypothetical_protein [Hexamita inflata]|uniref:Hypothetical_protein n=1 Tax=Hexamita inflata TaxID=28002 RepID=A0AA86RDN7_9EUKA|nr:Hypothetical protein HINF_LOCUS58179 [Hexamita inflata]